MSKNNKHSNYELSAKRKTILNVRTSKSDDEDEWDSILNWLKELGSGNAKEGLYNLAKENKVIK